MIENPQPYRVANSRPEDMFDQEGVAIRDAQEKLETLTNPTFTGFATRFMNLEEYRSVATTGYFKGEVIIIEDRTFNEYLEDSRDDWIETADRQTDWESAMRGMKNYEYLISALQELRHHGSREEALKEYRKFIIDNASSTYRNGDYPDVIRFPILDTASKYREYTRQLQEECEASFSALESAQPAIAEVINTILTSPSSEYKDNESVRRRVQPILSAAGLLQKEYERYFQDRELAGEDFVQSIEKNLISPGQLISWIHDNGRERNGGLLDEVDNRFRQIITKVNKLDMLGRKNLNQLAAFLEDSNYFSIKGNLRQIVRILAYDHSLDDDVLGASQYHVLALLQPNKEEDRLKSRTWDIMGSNDVSLLGAIAVMPDKDLADEMAKISSSVFHRSHPVFNSHGNIQWPRLDSFSSMQE